MAPIAPKCYQCCHSCTLTDLCVWCLENDLCQHSIFIKINVIYFPSLLDSLLLEHSNESETSVSHVWMVQASFTSLSNKGKEKSHIAVHMGSVSLLEIKEDGEKKYDELSFWSHRNLCFSIVHIQLLQRIICWGFLWELFSVLRSFRKPWCRLWLER